MASSKHQNIDNDLGDSAGEPGPGPRCMYHHDVNDFLPICPFCLGEFKNKYGAGCGHTGCLNCWNLHKVEVVNLIPFPPCPICLLPVSVLVKHYQSGYDNQVRWYYEMELGRIKGKFEAYQQASCEFNSYVIRPVLNDSDAGHVVREILKGQAERLLQTVADLKRDICQLAADDE